MVSFFRKKKSLAAAIAQETKKKSLQQEEQSRPIAVDSVESGNTATSTSTTNTSSSNSNSKQNTTSSGSTTIAVRKSSSWLGGGGGSRSKTATPAAATTTTTTTRASSFSSSPSSPPPLRPPLAAETTATANKQAAALQSNTTTTNNTNSNNNNRARRRKKTPGASGGGGSTSSAAGVSIWSRSSSRSVVSKLPTVQEEGEGGTTATPSTATGAGAGAEAGGSGGVGGVGSGGGIATPETLDTTISSTNDDDDDEADWISSIAIEPVVSGGDADALFDCTDGQVEILTLDTKQQRDDFLRDESIKRRLFQKEQQQLEQELQQKELQQLQQQQQQMQQPQQPPQEHAVKSVPMMPYPSASSDADCISKRSVSPLTISTGEKLLAAPAEATTTNVLLVAQKPAALLNDPNGSSNANHAKRSSSTPNSTAVPANLVGEDQANSANNRRARSSASDYPCTTSISTASDALIQPFGTRCGGVTCTSPSSWTENITVTVQSSSCTYVDKQDDGKAADGDGGLQQDVLREQDAQDGVETIEDQSTIPTFSDSASHNHKMHSAIMESSSSLASNSYAMRASSALGMGADAAAAAAASMDSVGHNPCGITGEAVRDYQQHVSSHKAQFQAVADKFSNAFNCTHAAQDIMAQPLGVMSMFYDKLCLSAHDRQKMYGKGQDDKDDQESEWPSPRNKPFFSEEFAVMFINRMVSEGISLLYLQSPGTAGNEGSVEWKGQSVTMVIAPGSTGEAEMIQPKLEWTTMPGGRHGQDMLTTSLPLLNIHSIITHVNSETLGDDMELDDDMCFFTITSRKGDVHVFEANTTDQRDAIVDGLQNAIARLAFHLVAGDSTASTELYNDDRILNNQQQQDAGELPALPNPRLNMNRIAHMMLDY